jgi:hypothetical protein
MIYSFVPISRCFLPRDCLHVHHPPTTRRTRRAVFELLDERIDRELAARQVHKRELRTMPLDNLD